MRTKYLIFAAVFITLSTHLFGQFDNPKLPLRVSSNGRSLEYENGKAFFWLGDTGWELLHRLDKSEVNYYLETRARQGFNVIQLVVIPELNGLSTPNRLGDLPLVDFDLGRPNEKYFQFVDYVVDKAASLGLFVAMMPSWGDAWNVQPHSFNRAYFTVENSFAFGKYIGSRYKNQWNIVWVMGGDRNPETSTHYAIIRSEVKGIKEGDGGKHLMTYHPGGDCSSASFFHEDKWLDFNMTQTGHSDRRVPTYLYSLNNYVMNPVKPCLDGEPRYEDLPVKFWEMKLDSSYMKNPYTIADSQTPYGYFNDYDVRTAAYWSVFSGACGHTYGNGSVWCFWQKGVFAPIAIKHSWQKAMNSPGGIQMGYLRTLMEQFGIDKFSPDRNAITNNSFAGQNYNAAIRAKDGSSTLIYSPAGEKFKVSLTKIKEGKVFATWFNPREGLFSKQISIVTSQCIMEFAPPSKGIDWVLVLKSE